MFFVYMCSRVLLYKTSFHAGFGEMFKGRAGQGANGRGLQFVTRLMELELFNFSHGSMYLYDVNRCQRRECKGRASQCACYSTIEGILFRQWHCLFYAIISTNKNKTQPAFRVSSTNIS